MAEPRPLSVLIAQNAAFSSLRFLAGVVSALLTAILVARHLGPQDFGTYRLALSLIWVLEFVSSLAFPNATAKFVAELSAGPTRAWASAVRFFLVPTTALWLAGFAGLLAVRHPVARFYRDEALAPLLLLAALAVLPGLWTGVLSAALQGRQRFGVLSLIGLVQAVATLVGSALIVSVGAGVSELLVLAAGVNCLGTLLAAIACRAELGSGGPPAALPPALRARMWRYSVLVGATALTGALLSERLEVFFLGRFWNATEVGFYSLAMTLAFHARRQIPSAIGEVLFPVIARLHGAGDAWGVRNAFVHATRYLAIVGFALGLGGAICAAPLLTLLFGTAYRPAAPALAILFAASGVIALSPPASSVILSTERHRFLLTSSLLVALANVLLDLLLIPPYAAVGAALANAITHSLLLAVQMTAVSRWLATSLPLGNLARALAAAAAAWLPAAVLRAWPLLGDVVDLGLGVAAFLLLYPLALAASGALIGEDIVRLRAVSQRLPTPGRVVAGSVLRTLGAWVRAEGPG